MSRQRVTVTVEVDGEPTRTVTRDDVDVHGTHPDARDVDLDAVLITAVADIRRNCDLPLHDLNALRWLASLPHPDAPVLEQWRGSGGITLTEVVNGLRPLIPECSLGAPSADSHALNAIADTLAEIINEPRPHHHLAPVVQLRQALWPIVRQLRAAARGEWPAPTGKDVTA